MKNKKKYKTIKWVLKNHINKNVKSLWTYENQNFTCIFKNYKRDSNIQTPSQMLEFIEGLINSEKVND